MKNELVSWRRVITMGGAFIAFLIGSGFATGQEIMQYFAAYGFSGIFTVLVMFVLFLYVGYSFITVGYEQQYHTGKPIFRYYCGKYVGTFFEWFSVIFIYMSYLVMIAGAGAALQQQFGLPNYAGGILIGILSITTVMFGLNRIVDVIGMIGPVIVVLAIFLGIAGVVQNPQGLAQVNEVLPTLNILKASPNWLLSAFSYVGFCMMWLAAFLASMGAEANSKKEAGLGAITGALFFSLATLFVMFGFLANLSDVAGSQIPSLILANNVSPVLAIIFSVIVILGIYTTAVPLLWTASSRVAPEKTARFRLGTLALGIAGVAIGLLVPFDRLVNVIYVLNGYIGFLLLFMMIIKSLRRILAQKPSLGGKTVPSMGPQIKE